MPDRHRHPEGEALAAWQAGALDRRERARVAAHLATCAGCAAVVSALERATSELTALPEPDLPPGFHERLAAAVEREATRLREAEVAPVTPLRLAVAGRAAAPARRSRAWRSRVGALGAAAALIALLAVAVPLVRGFDREQPAQTAGGAGTAAAPAGTAAGLPVFAAAGDYSASALRAGLSSEEAVKSAYQRAVASPAARSSVARPGSAPAAPGFQGESGGAQELSRDGAASKPSTSAGPAIASAPDDRQACIALARQAAKRPLRPAFFVDTTYRGRPATVLVTARADAPGKADLWVFPRGDCSAPPFASETTDVPVP